MLASVPLNDAAAVEVAAPTTPVRASPPPPPPAAEFGLEEEGGTTPPPPAAAPRVDSVTVSGLPAEVDAAQAEKALYENFSGFGHVESLTPVGVTGDFVIKFTEEAAAHRAQSLSGNSILDCVVLVTLCEPTPVPADDDVPPSPANVAVGSVLAHVVIASKRAWKVARKVPPALKEANRKHKVTEKAGKAIVSTSERVGGFFKRTSRKAMKNEKIKAVATSANRGWTAFTRAWKRTLKVAQKKIQEAEAQETGSASGASAAHPFPPPADPSAVPSAAPPVVPVPPTASDPAAAAMPNNNDDVVV